MCSYFTKDETECSQAIMNPGKEARAHNMTVAEYLRKIGAAFLFTRDVVHKNASIAVLPESWLRKIFPGRTVFVSNDLAIKEYM